MNAGFTETLGETCLVSACVGMVYQSRLTYLDLACVGDVDKGATLHPSFASLFLRT